MTKDSTNQEPKEAPSPITWVDFLQEHPPGSITPVTGAAVYVQHYSNFELASPELQLYCPRDTCNGYMFFVCESDTPYLKKGERVYDYLKYRCRNCRNYLKTFSVVVILQDKSLATAYKFGELPHFGPPLPPRVLRLIQPDRELFLQGRRCENQGLGIGAFTYYRRVLENQWSRLVGEIIKVAQAIKADSSTITALETAKNEQQFSKGVKNIKNAIPPALLINGHNPLILLHGSLSQGVHNLPDEECLSLATSIRVVLVELAEKLGQALKDEKELTDAINKLFQIQKKKQSQTKEANKNLEATSDSASSVPSKAPQD